MFLIYWFILRYICTFQIFLNFNWFFDTIYLLSSSCVSLSLRSLSLCSRVLCCSSETSLSLLLLDCLAITVLSAIPWANPYAFFVKSIGDVKPADPVAPAPITPKPIPTPKSDSILSDTLADFNLWITISYNIRLFINKTIK